VCGSIFKPVTFGEKVKSITTWSKLFSFIIIPYYNRSCKIFAVVTASLNAAELPHETW
jgi:RsiW-degrading membrane proteinase PrsW (M82 family)